MQNLWLCRWLSQEQDLINSDAMTKGVREAKVLMLMTTTNITKPERHWVHMEVCCKLTRTSYGSLVSVVGYDCNGCRQVCHPGQQEGLNILSLTVAICAIDTCTAHVSLICVTRATTSLTSIPRTH